MEYERRLSGLKNLIHKVLGVKIDAGRSTKRATDGRRIFTVIAIDNGFIGKEIASSLNQSTQNVSEYKKLGLQMLETDPEFIKKYEMITDIKGIF